MIPTELLVEDSSLIINGGITKRQEMSLGNPKIMIGRST
jgi:hypothetical protein